jgi:hypothetical protein
MTEQLLNLKIRAEFFSVISTERTFFSPSQVKGTGCDAG